MAPDTHIYGILGNAPGNICTARVMTRIETSSQRDHLCASNMHVHPGVVSALRLFQSSSAETRSSPRELNRSLNGPPLPIGVRCVNARMRARVCTSRCHGQSNLPRSASPYVSALYYTTWSNSLALLIQLISQAAGSFRFYCGRLRSWIFRQLRWQPS